MIRSVVLISGVQQNGSLIRICYSFSYSCPLWCLTGY